MKCLLCHDETEWIDKEYYYGEPYCDYRCINHMSIHSQNFRLYLDYIRIRGKDSSPENWYRYIGYYTSNICPFCNEVTVKNEIGTEWCPRCGDSNEREFKIFAHNSQVIRPVTRWFFKHYTGIEDEKSYKFYVESLYKGMDVVEIMGILWKQNRTT